MTKSDIHLLKIFNNSPIPLDLNDVVEKPKPDFSRDDSLTSFSSLRNDGYIKTASKNNDCWSITDLGRRKLESELLKSDNESSNINFNIRDNYGQINQGSDLRDNHQTFNNTTDAPTAKPNKKKAIIDSIVKFWWLVLVAVVAGIIVIAIERNWFDG